MGASNKPVAGAAIVKELAGLLDTIHLDTNRHGLALLSELYGMAGSLSEAMKPIFSFRWARCAKSS
jgi:hypothetical protein